MSASAKPKLQARQLRTAAERQLAAAPLRDTPASAAAQDLLHELQVHQIELEMQNEALRLAQIVLEASHERYVDLYEFAPLGYLTLTPGGLIAQINLTGAALLERERKALLKRRFTSFVAQADRDRWTRHFMGLLTGERQGHVALALQRADDTVAHVQLDCVFKEGNVRVTLTDISERKLAEDELRIAAIAFAAQNGMAITDPRGIIVRVNPAFTRLTGYSAAEAIGRTPGQLLNSGRHDKTFYQNMWRALIAKGAWSGEIWNRRENGNIYVEMLNITAIVTPEGVTSHYLASFTDITENKEAEAEIHRLAYYDALTRLPNRRLLYDRLGQALAASARSGLCGAIFFIDLDNFKALNDTRGHDAGDLLLVEVAQRLRAALREADTVSRQGGDEFVVLMENLGADLTEAAALARQLGDKLRAAIDRPFDLRGYEYHCKLSFGIRLFDAQDTIEALFKHADLALYQAKNSGRNQLRFFDPAMQASMDRRSALEADLRPAMALGQLRLFYQPQVDSTGRVIGVEALLRWQNPQRGLVLPDEFIGLAEDSGLILPIGHWVLETACAQLKAWADDALTARLQIAVNVSARQFRQTDFVAQVQGVLAASGANPARLKLELTESLVLDDVDDSIAKMQEIKRLGVSFSMDDFGTGYSSLSYLAKLPLDQLKIDRAFVRNLPGARNDETIARAIITLGEGLGMHVIAEGIETDAQHTFLAAHGCQAYQGYLFSHPLPIAALAVFLQGRD